MIQLLFMETFGCQMNERDSEIMAQLLGEHSYLQTDKPDKADVVVVNTCSIRGKAAHKAYSCFGRYKKLKAKNPRLILAVTGCVAQQDGASLLERMPYIDIVMGPQAIYALPSLVAAARREKKPQVATDLSVDFIIPPFLPSLADGAPHKRFITIMQGCDNFCTYCVVPYTRGREISRSFTDIMAEATQLVNQGIQELTLIGQNVNSYGKGRDGRQSKSFPELLRSVAAIDGLQRLRFTTSHPKDLSEELMRCFIEIPSLCPHFHLPVQSGSNIILQRMNRKYTIETYLDKVARLRKYRPDIALTTDIIIGFPGETDDDFAATMQVLDKVRYHGAYSFKYSDRPNAKAADFPDKVTEEIKSERLARLQVRQNEISLALKQVEIGKTVEVMVEGASKAPDNQWSGRTGANQIVNFACAAKLTPGQLFVVKIVDACQNSLRGQMI
ncbi:MAG TPA: tRNA (N6-isopentenyl adenosine(37)-C2)-methylthiotransferase MiaB [Desulfobulbaceae bacterium]|nr:MAG: tRNA (N6-isopentenyl adenosine(37)-C2)-methylthiotransferase MiaB [Deltaproteobacteria bacterium RIFOXYD12_FULL_53_23]HCC55075.1 tRNA (N6-isopentenyl adenosine(37)-C2)-methylthiotransferase MiaB [Desulfobulbaceae bacterium]